jgi:Clp amino terminal domain, pathogenicity island component
VPDVLERFSDQACRVVVRSREEARALNHNWIGTEHLMLALIAEGSGVAAQVLESLGISLAAARWLVEATMGRVEQAPSGELRFTPRATKVLELASGLSPGSDHTDTWHVLLGLLREGEGVGAMVLFTLGADLYRVGLRVTQLLSNNRGQDAPDVGSGLDQQAHARLLDNPLARIDALDRRLALVERSLSLDSDLGDLEQQTVTVRRETVAAVDMQEFEIVTGLRPNETQRPAAQSPRQRRLERAAAGQLPLARELGRLYGELDKLRAILREHGIDPGDDRA